MDVSKRDSQFCSEWTYVSEVKSYLKKHEKLWAFNEQEENQ